MNMQGEELEKLYGSWMRAAPRRAPQNFGSKWLKQEPMTVKDSEKMVATEAQAARGGGNRVELSKEKSSGGGSGSVREISRNLNEGEKLKIQMYQNQWKHRNMGELKS